MRRAQDPLVDGGVFRADATPEVEDAAGVEVIVDRSRTACFNLRRRCRGDRDRRNMVGGKEEAELSRTRRKTFLYAPKCENTRGTMRWEENMMLLKRK